MKKIKSRIFIDIALCAYKINIYLYGMKKKNVMVSND